MAVLIARSGPLTGHRYELEDRTVLGREDATITLPDEETSRHHAEIRVEAGAVLIEDLGSTNGTFVDGERIADAIELRGGETIKMGTTIFVLEVEVVAPSPEPIADPGTTRVARRPEILDPPAAATPSPDPIADPERTAMRPRPAAPEPIADPERTAMRPRPPAPAPEPIADPDRTAQRPRPSKPPPPRTPSREPVADPQSTRLRPRPPAPDPAPIADPERTAQRPRPQPREPVPAAAAAAAAPASRARSRPPAPAAPAAASVDQPFGTFAPPAKSRGRGAASRKLAPALASYATIIVTAVALVAYFAGR